MDLGIKGKKVLIVGVGNGIGPALALAFAREGGILTLISRSDAVHSDLKESLFFENTPHRYISADLMIDHEPAKLAGVLLSETGGFDIIIHNIGHHLGVRDPFGPVEDWMLIWKLNIGIAIEMNSVLIPPMIEKNWGRIIHMSSVSARMLRGSPQYCCSKAYINAYVQSVGRALADKGVVMTALMPGAVDFPNGYWHEIKQTNPEKYYGFLKEHQAIGRMGKPEEIADFAVFLGSDKVTFSAGAVVPIDGGHM